MKEADRDTAQQVVLDVERWIGQRISARHELVDPIAQALAEREAAVWKAAITCVQQTNPTSISDAADEAWAYIKRRIISRLEVSAKNQMAEVDEDSR